MEEKIVHERLAAIRRVMETESRLVKRNPDEIRLIGVCKHQPIEKIRAALAAGLQDLGQNYVQELKKQASELGDDFRRLTWHFVGVLQRNKVKDLLKLFPAAPLLIHTLDRPELAQSIHETAKNLNRTIPCLIQVMPEVEFSGMQERNGCRAEAVTGLLRFVKDLPHVAVHGLMILPPLADKPQEARAHFHFLRGLGKSLQREVDSLGCERIQLREYSMGMTADLKEAIQEGATYVRIGTGIFGERAAR